MSPGTATGLRRWVPIAVAVVTEVSATLALRAAVEEPAWYVATAIGYAAAFGLLAVALEAGAPVGVAYAVWSATGVAATAVLAGVLFGETLGPVVLVGIGLIVAGVVLVEAGSHRALRRRAVEVPAEAS